MRIRAEVSARTIQSWILKAPLADRPPRRWRGFSEDDPVVDTESSVRTDTTHHGIRFSEDDPVVDTESRTAVKRSGAYRCFSEDDPVVDTERSVTLIVTATYRTFQRGRSSRGY